LKTSALLSFFIVVVISSFELKEVNTITKENNPIVTIAFFIIWGFYVFVVFTFVMMVIITVS
jgi:hypothetical protein